MSDRKDRVYFIQVMVELIQNLEMKVPILKTAMVMDID